MASLNVLLAGKEFEVRQIIKVFLESKLGSVSIEEFDDSENLKERFLSRGQRRLDMLVTSRNINYDGDGLSAARTFASENYPVAVYSPTPEEDAKQFGDYKKVRFVTDDDSGYSSIADFARDVLERAA